jgi:hypothetical protein
MNRIAVAAAIVAVLALSGCTSSAPRALPPSAPAHTGVPHTTITAAPTPPAVTPPPTVPPAPVPAPDPPPAPKAAPAPPAGAPTKKVNSGGGYPMPVPTFDQTVPTLSPQPYTEPPRPPSFRGEGYVFNCEHGDILETGYAMFKDNIRSFSVPWTPESDMTKRYVIYACA